MIGRKLGNRYEIIDKLGGGGMAIVYKAKDTYLGRLVTIKILRPEYTSDEDFVRRFRREAKSVASLSHPNIVNIHDVGQEDDIHYLVMEYVPGDNLKNIIVKNQQLTAEEAVRYAIQVCAALDHAHANNIVHRDVKPHNILVTGEGRAKLTDFGIAQEATSATITRTDTIVGSVHYLSPEQIRGETATPRSDIYAVGILLYEMLTGQHPYSGDTAIAIALKHVQETPRPVDQVNLHVPPQLARIVMRAMEKEAQNRYQSADELARHLEMTLDDTDQATVFIPMADLAQERYQSPQGTRTDTMPAPGASPRKKSTAGSGTKTWLVLVLVMLAGLLMGGGYGLFRYLNVPDIPVPSVVGKPVEQAEAELKRLGLQVQTEEQYSDQEVGIVVNQDVGPDHPEVKRGRKILLTVSKGEEIKKIPSLYNLTAEEAENKLLEAGLVPAPTESHHNKVDKGLVFEQLPAAGARVSKGAQVHFTISLGPEPVKHPLPSLLGKTLEEARNLLKKLNLGLDEDEKQYDFDPNYQRHQIIRQTPDPDTEVEEGTKVKVVLNDTSNEVAKQVNVKITDEIPNDGRSHKVEIVVDDVAGKNVQYVGYHTYTHGDEINHPVTYVGHGTLFVYIDGEQIMAGELR